MTTYYVSIPGSEKAPTAEVTAPDTKHARTAYLDYLARNDLIRWSDRGAVRKRVKTNRMQPGEIQTQISLSYGRIEESEYQVPTEEERRLTAGEPQEEVYYPQLTEEEERLQVGELHEEEIGPEDEVREEPAKDFFGSSPIMDLSKKSKGM